MGRGGTRSYPFTASAAGVPPAVCSYEGVAYVGSEDGVSERPLPLAGWASLRERSAPFKIPPDAG